MAPKTLPDVSVIVPVYNAAGALPRLIRSLRAQQYPGGRVRLILVDNGSTDASRDVIRQHANVTLLSQTRYRTPGATRNAGVEAADTDVLAFIDADCWANPDWLRRGVLKLVGEGLDRVAGAVRFAPSRRPNIYEIYDSQINFRQPDFLAKGWCGTGNLFARRALFQEVGLFDPVLLSNEDLEFGLRASRAGKTLGYEPRAVIHHRARTRLASLVRKWMRTEYGAAQVYRRHGLLGLQLWTRKANYRPLWGTWRAFPPDARQSPRARWAIDGIANILRYAGDLGNFVGYMGLRRVGFLR